LCNDYSRPKSAVSEISFRNLKSKDYMSIPFDICVITAANEQQARGYKMQLDWRMEKELLPQTIFRIIADPDGARIGSGGSTFYALASLNKEFGDTFSQKRILILHSGGDSRRLPAYSIVGKLFAPLPTEKHHALFDIMLENYAQLPSLAEGQVIVASGDVLLNFDPAFVNFSSTGVTGVAYPDSPEQGQFFGVYIVRDPKMEAAPTDDVLQKPDLTTLKDNHAIDFTDRIWIDTGILNFASDAVQKLLECTDLIEDAGRAKTNINLYHEILYAMCGKIEITNSDILSKISVFTSCLPYCGFYHVGRSKELLQSFYTLSHASVQYKFQNLTRSNSQDVPGTKAAWIFNTIVRTDNLALNKPSMVEACILDNEIRLDGRNIVTNIPGNTSRIHLSEGICLNVVPLVDGQWAAVLYGIEDQFKTPNATFLNQPIFDLINNTGLPQSDFWINEKDTGDPWCASLFPVAQSANEAIVVALLMQSNDVDDDWKNTRRLSMKEILHAADHKRLLDFYGEIERLEKIYSISRHIESSPGVFAEIAKLVKTNLERQSVISQLQKMVDRCTDDPISLAKLNYLLGRLGGDDAKPTGHVDKAFAAIQQGVARGLHGATQHLHEPRLAIQSDQVTWVMLPARFDFAGGWTDTPPICLERGGCVLNASVTLNGQYPIQVIGKIRPDVYTIGINSIDLAQRATITSMDELHNFQNPAEWLSLPKAAFFAAGIFSEHEDGDLSALLKKMGGGIDLTLFSALPSGSGLGTSSILGAGIIAALARMMGVDMPRQELYARTSYMEQLMTTGGGWQDHVGGVSGGVKLITSSPGYDQTPTLSWAQFKQLDMALDEHYLLYYTGIRRLAKNLLRQVVGHFLEQQPGALQVLDDMEKLARSMKDDLDHRRFEAFGRKIGRSWELNKALDQGQTTDEIESILARIDDDILGAKLLGAGGGGFLFIAAKDRRAAQRIRHELDAHPPNDRARFFDFDIDSEGMKVTVL
jgi:galactokinase/mevalonate kinase-like predicted kinase